MNRILRSIRLSLSAVFDPEFEALESEWLKKLSELDRLLLIINETEKIAKHADRETKLENLELMARDLDAFHRLLTDEINVQIPLVDSTKFRLEQLKKRLKGKLDYEARRRIDILNQRLAELEKCPEEDLQIAFTVLQVSIFDQARQTRILFATLCTRDDAIFCLAS